MTTPLLAQRLDAALYILHLMHERLPISSLRDIARGRGLPTRGTAQVLLVKLYNDIVNDAAAPQVRQASE